MAFEKYNIYFVNEHNNSLSYEPLCVHLRSDEASKFSDLCGLLKMHKNDITLPTYPMYYHGKKKNYSIFYFKSDRLDWLFFSQCRSFSTYTESDAIVYIRDENGFETFKRKNIDDIYVGKAPTGEVVFNDQSDNVVNLGSSFMGTGSRNTTASYDDLMDKPSTSTGFYGDANRAFHLQRFNYIDSSSDDEYDDDFSFGCCYDKLKNISNHELKEGMTHFWVTFF